MFFLRGKVKVQNLKENVLAIGIATLLTNFCFSEGVAKQNFNYFVDVVKNTVFAYVWVQPFIRAKITPFGVFKSLILLKELNV